MSAADKYEGTEVEPGVCNCADDLAHAVAALVADGWSQREASLAVFGEAQRAADMVAERASLSERIRDSFLSRWPDLRLPGASA